MLIRCSYVTAKDRILLALQSLSTGIAPELVEIPRPTPQPGEVLVRVAYCGLNFADLLIVKGTYQDMPPHPITLGLEMAGTVVACGEGVPNVAPGDRVAVYHGHGGLAEYGCFPAAACVKVPQAMDLRIAAGFQIAYATSYLALEHRAQLRSGETLVVTGAAGGVGLTAVEIGRHMGARVIAIARGKEKLEVAKAAGADILIDAEDDDIREQLKALGGIDVAYETVGGALFEACFRAARPLARLLVIGFAGGQVPEAKLNHLMVKNVSVIGLYVGGYRSAAPEVLAGSLSTLMEWYLQGALKPHISHEVPLARAQEGLDLLAMRAATGKVIVKVSDLP